jgi:hypothetical protein
MELVAACQQGVLYTSLDCRWLAECNARLQGRKSGYRWSRYPKACVECFYPAERVECQVSDKVVVSKVRRRSDRIRRCRLLCMTCGTADHESVHFDAEPGSY